MQRFMKPLLLSAFVLMFVASLASPAFAAPKKDKGGGGDKPSQGTLIGPEGGTVQAGDGAYLIVPAGALDTEVSITASDSFTSVPLDSATILTSLQVAADVADAQGAYITGLPTKDDGSGEWVNKGTKKWLNEANGRMANQTAKALSEHRSGNHGMAAKHANRAVNATHDLEEELEWNDGKVGAVAQTIIANYNTLIREELTRVDNLYDSTFLFEFGPHGTVFAIPAELVVPLDEVSISNEFAWYSGDGGTSIEISDTQFFVDEVNETVHYFIDHFSQYYFQRPR